MTEIHGHRGCDDGVPPNTVPAFLRATGSGCHWLEMDVVLTGDGQVLVSHEPWMDHQVCVDPEGNTLTEAQGRGLNLYRMSVEEIQRYRVLAAGCKGKTAPKPTLSEVVGSVRQWSSSAGRPMPGFNIEVKSDPEWYDVYQPRPEALAEAVLRAIRDLQIEEQCLIQCFDPAILEALHAKKTAIPLAFLIDNIDRPQLNLQRLSFKPALYSTPHFLATEALVAELDGLGIRLLTWTVNDPADMQRIIDLGVHGLITDRPAEAMRLLHGSR